MMIMKQPIHAKCLRPITTHYRSSNLQLIAFPHAGAGAGYFRSWAQFIPSYIELIGVQYPGREDRIFDEPVSDIKKLSLEIADDIQQQEYDQIILFGHSMGAILAYEVACHLQKNGMLIKYLFVSGQTEPTKTRKTLFYRSTDKELIHEVIRVSETSKEIFENKELREIFLSIIRNDYEAIETYSTETPTLLSTPITVLLGDDDTEVTYQEAISWSAYTKYRFDIYTFPGEHFFINKQLKQVIEIIIDKLHLLDTSYENFCP